MDDDEDSSGGGTLVIDPNAAAARRGEISDESTTALELPPGVPMRQQDSGPMATQILPLTEEQLMQRAPRPAAGVPASGAPQGVKLATTLALPGSSPPPPMPSLPMPSAPMPSLPMPSAPMPSAPMPSAPMQPQSAPHMQQYGEYIEPAPQTEQYRAPSFPTLPKPFPDQPPTMAESPAGRRGFADSPTVVSRPKSGRGLFVFLGALVAIAVAALGVILFLRLRDGGFGGESSSKKSKTSAPAESTKTAPQTATSIATLPTTPATTPPPVNPTNPTTSSPATAAPPANETPEAAATAALIRLRDAVDHCVKSGTHILPGTSPMVPDSMTKLKGGPYQSTARDWNAQFFNCAQFKVDKPMAFAIQWQLQIPNWLGLGVAWVDTNGDGVSDKSFAFTARLKDRDVVEYTDIAPIDGSHLPTPR